MILEHGNNIRYRKEEMVFIILFLAMLMMSETLHASQNHEETNRIEIITDSLVKVLNHTKNWNDRKRILYDISDLRANSAIYDYSMYALYAEGMRHHDTETVKDALLNASNGNNTDTLALCYKRILEIEKKDPTARPIAAFVKAKINWKELRGADAKRAEVVTHELINDYKKVGGGKADIYDSYIILNSLCLYLAQIKSQGELYHVCLKSLEGLAYKMPESAYFMKSSIWTTLSIAYNRLKMREDAAKIDRLLIELIHKLEKRYADKGRKYKNYYNFYMILYRRALSNYEALTLDEVEAYRNSIYQLANKTKGLSELVRLGFPRTNVYYNMANKRYDAALTSLNVLMSHKNFEYFYGMPLIEALEIKLEIYRHLKNANKNDYLATYKKYVEILDKNIQDMESGNIQEMNILYDVNSLSEQNQKLVIDKQNAEISSKNRILLLVILVVVMMFGVICVLLYVNFKKRKYSESMSARNMELVKMQEKLILAKSKAEESERLKSAFLANMSHEIRTPLNAIVGFSELLLDTTDEDDKQEYSNIISTNSDLLLRLINDILELSKLEAGTMTFDEQEFDMVPFFNEISKTMKQRLKNPAIRFISVNPYKSCKVCFDKNRISQLLLNFTTNAIKYTEKGFIRVGYEYVDNGIKIYAQDSGLGISADKKDRVFGRFEKLDTFAQGTGLGLSICKSIVEKVGGRIDFDSEEGAGSTFWAWIPMTAEVEYFVGPKPDDIDKDDTNDNNDFKCSLSHSLKVLVVEDNYNDYRLVSSMLAEQVKLDRADNGLDAVEMVRNGKYDIVLMDLKMPILDGISATKRIREFDKQTPIIAVTANGVTDTEKIAMEAGCDCFMSKSLKKRELYNVIMCMVSETVATDKG